MFLFVVGAVLQLQLVFKAAALEGELGELEVQGADRDLDLQGAVVELGEAFAVRGSRAPRQSLSARRPAVRSLKQSLF